MKVATPPAPLRTPTREQKRQIVALLDVVYDTKNERYKDDETDKTVAEAIGGGVMPGWVSEIREQMYGPDGRNSEMENLIADMEATRDEMKRLMQNTRIHTESAEKGMREMEERLKVIGPMKARLEAIIKAVGPKAGG